MSPVQLPFSRRAVLGAAAQRLGVSSSSKLVLGAVAAVLLFVSLSRLHIFAVHENERDAVKLLRSLGPRAVEAAGAVLPSAGLPSAQVLLSDEIASERLADVGWVEDGQVLRRHGYLFGLRQAVDGTWCLMAWPWKQGRTGKAAFVFHPTLGVRGHPNSEGVWSGPESLSGETDSSGAGLGELNPGEWLELELGRESLLSPPLR